MAKIKIAFITENKNKENEYKNIMGLHGYKVDIFPSILQAVNNNYDYILMENSNLYNEKDEIVTEYNEMIPCKNVSHLTVLDQLLGLKKEYKSSVDGYINPYVEDEENNENWFGFDNKFILSSTNLSYKDSALLGMKVSARNNVLSQFIEEVIRKNIKQHNFTETNIEQPIQFSVKNFIEDNIFIKNIFDLNNEKSNLFQSILSNTVSDGLFFRSSTSSRESNYWFPGLNSGIPIVPKKDEIHELTFMMHDIMHHLSPDLVFTGDTSDEARKVYMVHRMMGEAISMVLADYLFVDLLKETGVEYNFNKRKIYPVFDYMMNNSSGTFNEKIKNLCYQNVLFALTGEKLPVPDDIRIPYEEKYSPYFIEDYRWTDKNFNTMSEMETKTKVFSQWGEHINLYKNKLLSIEQMKIMIGDYETPKDLIDKTFHKTWNYFLSEKISESKFDDSDNGQYSAFRRYMTGQSFLLFKYGHLLNMKNTGKTILTALNNNEKQENIQKLFDNQIDIMEKNGIISKDDSSTFKIVAPIFNPFFVYYEGKRKDFQTINEAMEGLIGTVEQLNSLMNTI